jgi:hypothetical protein
MCGLLTYGTFTASTLAIRTCTPGNNKAHAVILCRIPRGVEQLKKNPIPAHRTKLGGAWGSLERLLGDDWPPCKRLLIASRLKIPKPPRLVGHARPQTSQAHVIFQIVDAASHSLHHQLRQACLATRFLSITNGVRSPTLLLIPVVPAGCSNSNTSW